jgi:hypothetical protein
LKDLYTRECLKMTPPQATVTMQSSAQREGTGGDRRGGAGGGEEARELLLQARRDRCEDFLFHLELCQREKFGARESQHFFPHLNISHLVCVSFAEWTLSWLGSRLHRLGSPGHSARWSRSGERRWRRIRRGAQPRDHHESLAWASGTVQVQGGTWVWLMLLLSVLCLLPHSRRPPRATWMSLGRGGPRGWSRDQEGRLPRVASQICHFCFTGLHTDFDAAGLPGRIV